MVLLLVKVDVVYDLAFTLYANL